jgi:hypothetical protein
MKIRIEPTNPGRIKKAHTPHRSGAGIHGDRRVKRLKTRNDANRYAIRTYS